MKNIKSMKNQQSGFTLVEIAIVLVIIGLLLGGILKGQELINSAKVKAMVNDMKLVATQVYGYQDRFKAMPGDDPRANTNLAGAIAATTPALTLANGRIEGAWNSTTPTDESFLFWQHVRFANLATGSTDITAVDYRPLNSENGNLGITSAPVLTAPTTPFSGSFFVCQGNINGRFARQIDTTLDDGNPATGSVRIMVGNNTATAADATTTAAMNTAGDGAVYTVCVAF
jgi:prepilin-type N-terminal cleavage/methylation domain-containing protein